MSEGRNVSISRDHPALSGHFPGNPVVPGVLILEEVHEAICQVAPQMIDLVGAPTVKFHSPLRPDQVMTIHVEPGHSHEWHFSCKVGTNLIASGQLTYHQVNPSSTSQP